MATERMHIPGMGRSLNNAWRSDGYISGIQIVTEVDAKAHRCRMEKCEENHDNVHYLSKVHTIMTSPLELATHPRALDVIEQLIGPDILLYNVTYIVKEPKAPSHVSWHQDLTYWGLSHDDQVSMWLALSPANESSGCMRMLPGSHKHGQMHHAVTSDASNVLLQGQTVEGVDEKQAVSCPLLPGEASFHHGWVLHASMPNQSNDRRIGLNVQYIAPHVRQVKHALDTAMLVRGKDSHNNFKQDFPATTDLAPEAMQRHQQLQRRYVEIAGRA